MTQSAVHAAPPRVNRLSGGKDTDPAAAVSARLRSNREQPVDSESGQQKARNEAAASSNREVHKSPVDETRSAVEQTPARMTRQRTAIATPLEEHSTTNKATESPPQSATSAEAVSQICLCVPDPKIPRPRNAFILYRQHNQQTIISQNRGLSNPEISKIAGQLWQAEPEEVKNEWKALAEEEKARHAQQYPEYRFQPRHKSKTSPTTGPGEKVRCLKCGGQSIAANASPFPTPVPQSHPRATKLVTSHTQQQNPITPKSARESEGSSQRRKAMLNTSTHSHHGDPRSLPAGSPLTRKFLDGAESIELSDPKRRRYDMYGGSVAVTRPELARTIITNGPTPTSAHTPYPSPRLLDPRRPSISGQGEGSYYVPRPSAGMHADSSPPPMTPHSAAAPVMGPPLSRGPSISGRSALHAYPATSTSGHHGLPYPATSRPRVESESLRLAPLLSPGAGDHSRSIAAMIMTIPVVGKLGQLRRIAPPLKDPAPDSPGHRVRGSIIAIEGDDRASAEAMLGQLESFLRRNEEFDVRVLSGPQDPKPGCVLKDYLTMVCGWHDETERMIDFVTGVDYQRTEECKAREAEASSPSITSHHQTPISEPMDMDLEEGEVLEDQPHKAKKTTAQSRDEQEEELEKKKEEMAAAVEREARRQSAAAEHSSKIPILLVSNYILSGSNAWSSTLPISDVYSPADHWAWTATLWRGVVGADLTVYVRNVEREREEPVSAGASVTASPTEKKVELKDDIGALLVKRESGKVEEASVRRVAFEVGEWVRTLAGKAHSG